MTSTPQNPPRGPQYSPSPTNSTPSSSSSSSLLHSLSHHTHQIISSHANSNQLLTSRHRDIDAFLDDWVCVLESGMVAEYSVVLQQQQQQHHQQRRRLYTWSTLIQTMEPLIASFPNLNSSQQQQLRQFFDALRGLEQEQLGGKNQEQSIMQQQQQSFHHGTASPQQQPLVVMNRILPSGSVLKVALNLNILALLLQILGELFGRLVKMAQAQHPQQQPSLNPQHHALLSHIITSFYNSNPSNCPFTSPQILSQLLTLLRDFKFIVCKLRINFTEELAREERVATRLRELRLVTGANSPQHLKQLSSPQANHDPTESVPIVPQKRRKKTRRFPSAKQHRLLNSQHGCLLNAQERTLLRHQLPKHLQHRNWHLLFSTQENDSRIKKFFECTRDCGPSILVVQPVQGRCFGVFASTSWRGDVLKRFYGDSDCFLFTFNHLTENSLRAPAGQQKGKSQSDTNDGGINVYRATHRNDFYLFSQQDSIAVGGGTHFGMWIDEAFECGFSKKSKTFSNPPLSENVDFAIQNCECWSLKKPSRITEDSPFARGERVWHPVTNNNTATTTGTTTDSHSHHQLQHNGNRAALNFPSQQRHNQRFSSDDEEFDWGAEMDEPLELGEHDFSDPSLDALTDDRTLDTIGKEMGGHSMDLGTPTREPGAEMAHHNRMSKKSADSLNVTTNSTDAPQTSMATRQKRAVVVHGCLLSLRADVLDKLPRVRNLIPSEGYRYQMIHEARRERDAQRWDPQELCKEYAHSLLGDAAISGVERSSPLPACSNHNQLSHLRALSYMCNRDLDIEYSMNRIRAENYKKRSNALLSQGSEKDSSVAKSIPPIHKKPCTLIMLSKYAARMERKRSILDSLMRHMSNSSTGSSAGGENVSELSGVSSIEAERAHMRRDSSKGVVKGLH